MNKIDKDLFKDLIILYVEDDLMTSEEISFFLKKYVKELHTAKNGEEGLALFKEHEFDMVITDIQMPKMNGLEMCEKIFEINPNVPVAITTAYSDGDYIMRAIELGIDKYIVKPINMHEIMTIIQKSVYYKISLNKDVYYKDYIKFILETSPTFMFVLQSQEIEYVNDKFLKLIGEENIESLNKHLSNCSDLFELSENPNENWIEYIMKNDEASHLVKMKNEKLDDFNNIYFYVKYKKFTDINKSVFIFFDSYEDKLKKINLITKNILERNDDISCLDDIKKIDKISDIKYFIKNK